MEKNLIPFQYTIGEVKRFSSRESRKWRKMTNRRRMDIDRNPQPPHTVREEWETDNTRKYGGTRRIRATVTDQEEQQREEEEAEEEEEERRSMEIENGPILKEKKGMGEKIEEQKKENSGGS